MKQLLKDSKNVVPERVTARGSNALRLRLTIGKDVYLLNKDGKVTEYGRYWYDEVKNEATPRTQFDPIARLVKKIRTDYIRTMDGKEKAVRTWKPQLGTYTYTALGREYFLQRPRQYIVNVPIRVHYEDRLSANDARRSSDGVEGYTLATDLNKEVRALVVEGITGVIEDSTRSRIKELILRKLIRRHFEGFQFITSQPPERSSQPTFEEYMAKVNSGEEKLFLQDYPRGVYDPKREWLVDF